MRYQQLEAYKGMYPHLADLITKLDRYLGQKVDDSSSTEDYNHYRNLSNSEIRPSFIARSIKEDVDSAFVLLTMAEKAGILEHTYHVFCPEENLFIKEFQTKEELPEVITCNNHGFGSERHSINDYFVEVVFYLSHEVYESKHYEMVV